MAKPYLFALTVLLTLYLQGQSNPNVVYHSQQLTIEQLGKNLFKHISLIVIPDYGSFPCNGVVYFSEGEAVILDTPVDEKASRELISWVEESKKHKITGVIINHFHDDCLGGLGVFHSNGIPSFASDQTLRLAKEHEKTVPMNGFTNTHHFDVGNTRVISSFMGKAHSRDNLISYLPEANALFGGCMIKSMNATKGNLEDADTEQWPVTVEKIKATYPGIQLVIPGHGREGGKELLDYTIELFRNSN